MNRMSTSSVTLHRAYGSIPQPNLLWPRVLPFYSSVSGPWEHGGRYLLLTDRKHLSFVPPDRTRQKNHNRKVLSGRVASETSFSEEEASSSGSSYLNNDVRIGRLILGIRKSKRERTESLCFSDISNQTE